MKKFILLSVLVSMLSTGFAQHEHQQQQQLTDTVKQMQADTVAMQQHMSMSSFFSPGLPMSRDGSGTSWQPDDNPMYMYMKMFHDKNAMTTLSVHGSMFIRYTSQDITNQSSRGNTHFDALVMRSFILGQPCPF